MKDDFLVSVVMITYGHEQYIEEAINGVYLQNTNFNIELIISNDSSPDQTDDVVNEMIKKAPQNVTVKYFCHKLNKGMSGNFVWALQQASGKYIALCEGDDYWSEPLKLQKQVDFLESNEEYSFCCHRFTRMVEGVDNNMDISVPPKNILGIEHEQRFYKNRDLEIDYKIFYQTWVTQPLTTVFRNKYTDGLIVFSKLFTQFRDVHLFYYLLKHGNGYSFNKYMAVYRQHEGGAESGKSITERLFIKKEIWKEFWEKIPSDQNLRVQYIESTLRLMKIVDLSSRFKLYKELLRVSNSFFYFLKVNFIGIKLFTGIK